MDSYVALIYVALVINAWDWRMMALSATVGFGVLVPIPDLFFYAFCIGVELLVAMVAAALRTPASKPVCGIALVLTLTHCYGYWMNGYPVDSPYHFLVRIAEHAELIACILFSKLILGRLKHAA